MQFLNLESAFRRPLRATRSTHVVVIAETILFVAPSASRPTCAAFAKLPLALSLFASMQTYSGDHYWSGA